MKKQTYPYEQTVVFDDEGIEVSNGSYMEGFSWALLNYVCEDNRYWFFGAHGIAIDKKQLDEAEYQFIKKKIE